MAMPAGPELLVETYKNSLLVKEWAHEYPEAFVDSVDEMTLQRLHLEDYYRRNSILIDNIVEELGISKDSLIVENMWTDIAKDVAIGFGTKIPFIGPAVAVGGMLYYFARMLTAYNKGEKLTSLFEFFSGVGVSAAVVPGVGDAINAVMSTITKWAKGLLNLLKPAGVLLKPFKVIFNFLKSGGGKGKDQGKGRGRGAGKANAKAKAKPQP